MDTPATTSALKRLYETPLDATRSGALYHAHSYPTKISPESIALMIACHTKPGDLVFDGFGGVAPLHLRHFFARSHLTNFALLRSLKV